MDFIALAITIVKGKLPASTGSYFGIGGNMSTNIYTRTSTAITGVYLANNILQLVKWNTSERVLNQLIRKTIYISGMPRGRPVFVFVILRH